MRNAWLLGGAAPYREAVSVRLRDVGLTVVDDGATLPGDVEPLQTIVVAFCSVEEEWSRLEGLGGYLGRTAVIDRLDTALYERALADGIGVVHIDTKSEAIVATAMAAGRGETLIPMEVARRLVHGFAADYLPGDLDGLERDLLRSLANGETLVSVSQRYHYSDRTLRRRLQSAYLKLGVHDRAGAIRAAERLGML